MLSEHPGQLSLMLLLSVGQSGSQILAALCSTEFDVTRACSALTDPMGSGSPVRGFKVGVPKLENDLVVPKGQKA